MKKKNGRTKQKQDKCAQTVGFVSRLSRSLVVLHNDPSVTGAFRLSVAGRCASGVYLMTALVSFWMTSCAPPSTMLVAETRVSTAFS